MQTESKVFSMVRDDHFRQLLEAAPDAIVIVDGGGAIRSINQMTEILFGYDRAELMGQPIECLIPERFRQHHHHHRAAYFNRAHTRPMGSGLELNALRKDGTEFPVEISLSPLQTPDGNVVISVIRDITERRQAQQTLEQHARELERSNAELQQFAYVASHDLQEPLRMVASYAQLLDRRYRDRLDGDALEFIDYIVDGATRMQHLINDLLAFSRVGTREQTFAAVDANTVVKRVIANLGIAIEETGAKISVEELPPVMGDSMQLVQLLQNLIGNAIKFHGDSPPQIHISARTDNDMIRFAVTDNGIGIDPQYAERIFQLFQRLHNKRDYPGTGIGLAICKKIVERHGGKIWLESDPGSGTSFYFTLHPVNQEL